MQLICPACGTAARIPDDSDLSHVSCAGCGKRLSTRSILKPQLNDPLAPPLELLAATVGQSAGPVVNRRPLSPATVVPASKHRAGWPVIAMFAFAGLVVLVVPVLFIAFGSSKPVSSLPAGAAGSSEMSPASAPATEPLTGPLTAPLTGPLTGPSLRILAEVQRLAAAASDAAVDGDLHESYRLYKRLSQFASDNPSTDPQVISAVAEADARRGKIADLLMDQEKARTATAPSVAHGEPTTMPTIVAANIPSAARPPIGSEFKPAATQSLALAATTQPGALRPVNPADVQPAIPGVPHGPRPVLTLSNDNGVTDAEIGDAIARGIVYVQGRFRNGTLQSGRLPIITPGGPVGNLLGRLMGGGGGPGGPGGGTGGRGQRGFGNDHPDVSSIDGANAFEGFDALAAYALLHAGQATDGNYMQKDDPFTRTMLDALKRMDMPFTYWRSLRASALAVYHRVEDRAALEADVAWLVNAHRGGGYTYLSYSDNRTTQSPNEWDNSNSQYGLLGVWSGAEAGISVPSAYWNQVAGHWNSSQMRNGQWGYASEIDFPTLSMTLAGTASELVCSDYLDNGATNGRGRPTPAEAALNWLDTGDNCTSDIDDNQWHGYVLYGLERVGLASGYKYFGDHDWYAEFAKKLVANQRGDGSWGAGDSAGSVMETAYALLFLSRGRHPILYNHIRYDGAWNTHPRAVAHLARYAAKSLEKPLNWQVVNFSRPWYDWMDSPVLYLSGSDTPKLNEADYKQLQAFANAGGLIFTHADNGSAAFNVWVDRLVRKIFPDYEFSLIPAGHPIYSTVVPIKQPPLLKVVTNGSRILLIHSARDIAEGWQANWVDARKTAFQMGVNLFVYAAGKANFKNRLLSPYIPAYTETPDRTYPVARLQYAGHWNPEPYAWTRFGRFFSFATHGAVEERQLRLSDLTPAVAPLAVLTGTVRNDFTDAEVTAALNYVDGGGVLLIDACGGRPEFIKSVTTTLLAKAFPDSALRPLPDDHPLLIASRPNADDLEKPLLRPYASENGGRALPLLGFAYGKGHVIFSRLDLTTGLLGTNQWGIMGYDPSYCSALMKNAVLWANARVK